MLYSIHILSIIYNTTLYTPIYTPINPTSIRTSILIYIYIYIYTYYIHPYIQVFGRLLWGMDPFEALEDEDIRTAIANANGTLIHLTHIHTTCTPHSYTLLIPLLIYTPYTPTHTPLYIGTRPSLFVPEISFDLLVRKQIGRLEAPGSVVYMM